MFRLLFCTLYALCTAPLAHALPVIFGYTHAGPAEGAAGTSATEKGAGLFMAGVNRRHRRPMSMHGDRVAYNVDAADLPNFIPEELHTAEPARPPHDHRRHAHVRSDARSTEAQKLHHLSYREVVTRSTRKNDLREEDIAGAASKASSAHSPAQPELDNSSVGAGGAPLEECYGNAPQLPRRIVKRMNRKRRRLAQSIRRLNKLQRAYCLARRHTGKTDKCPAWRTEKMALYVQLMQLTHCTNARPVSVKL